MTDAEVRLELLQIACVMCSEEPRNILIMAQRLYDWLTENHPLTPPKKAH